jgi:ferredoxin-NADP reductase
MKKYEFTVDFNLVPLVTLIKKMDELSRWYTLCSALHASKKKSVKVKKEDSRTTPKATKAQF